MKPAIRWIKYIACALVIVSSLLLIGDLPKVNAAGNIITVSNYLTGKKVYEGDSLQEAFAASERGCIVTIGDWITLESDVYLSAEIMLSGGDKIEFGDYRILLSGDGALFSNYEFRRTKYFGTVNSYSRIKKVEESGGFLYYMITEPPTFEGVTPKATPRGKLLGAAVSPDGTIYLDIACEGISQEELANCISVPALYSETVTNSFRNASGAVGIGNGGTLIASATNFDYDGEVTKSYSLIILGDVNGNGMVDSADASLIARHAAGTSLLSGNALLAADANQDGYVTDVDAHFICMKYIRPSYYVSPFEQE